MVSISEETGRTIQITPGMDKQVRRWLERGMISSYRRGIVIYRQWKNSKTVRRVQIDLLKKMLNIHD